MAQPTNIHQYGVLLAWVKVRLQDGYTAQRKAIAESNTIRADFYSGWIRELKREAVKLRRDAKAQFGADI